MNQEPLINEQNLNVSDTIRAIPEILKLLNDSDQIVVSKTVLMIHCLLQYDKNRMIIVNSRELVQILVRIAIKSIDIETLKYLSAIFHTFSLSKPGLLAIYQNNVLPVLYKMLDSNEVNIVHYSISTLHTLVLKQDGAKNAVRRTGGIPTIVRLLSKDDPKFLAIVTDCLQLVAYNSQEGKLAILQSGGPRELIRIMNTYKYEKLLWTTIRVIKVLSVCPRNKHAIVLSGGMQALAKNLYSETLRVVLNSLWALRNLSDAATNQTNMEELLKRLVLLLQNEDVNIVTCAAGILANLTCNNYSNKQVIFDLGGLRVLLDTLVKFKDSEIILEPCLCALRHLTCRHPSAQQCQDFIRINCGLQPIIRLLHPPSKWLIIKSCINLIRNLALSSANNQPLRENYVIQRLFQLLSKAHEEIKRVCTIMSYESIVSCSAEGIKMYEIIEGALGTLQILAKDQLSCELIINLDVIPVCIELIYYPLENIQKVAIGCLNELAKLPQGAEKIDLENSQHNVLQSLLSSPNEYISSTSASVQGLISDLFLGF